MTGDRLAVIDLGSNTFHLLICEFDASGDLIPVFKSRVYVKLATGGLGFIDPESEERGLSAMVSFAGKIEYYNVKAVKAVGTSALREASNGKEIAERYLNATGIKVNIIDGFQEADYILGGTKLALPALDQHGLIMDIGGGSVEFILFKGDDIVFKGSYKIGVSVLFQLFHQSDPISADQLAALEHYVGEQLHELTLALKSIRQYYLIGSSGSFEVIQELLPHISTAENWSELDLQPLTRNLERIISCTFEERKAFREIPHERLDYIVVAFALIRYITFIFPPERLFYCDFALKEGVLSEMASEL